MSLMGRNKGSLAGRIRRVCVRTTCAMQLETGQSLRSGPWGRMGWTGTSSGGTGSGGMRQVSYRPRPAAHRIALNERGGVANFQREREKIPHQDIRLTRFRGYHMQAQHLDQGLPESEETRNVRSCRTAWPTRESNRNRLHEALESTAPDRPGRRQYLWMRFHGKQGPRLPR